MANIVDDCVLCQKEGKTIDHLFLHCEVTSCVGCHFINRCGLMWCSPCTILEFAKAGVQGPFCWCELVLWWLIPFGLRYPLDDLEERNEMIFMGLPSSLEDNF